MMDTLKYLHERWHLMGLEQASVSDLLSEEEEESEQEDVQEGVSGLEAGPGEGGSGSSDGGGVRLTPDAAGDVSATQFKIPKMYCSTKDKRFDLFDRFSYAQLVEFSVRSKIPQAHRPGPRHAEGGMPGQDLCGTQRNRGIFYSWLRDHVDLSNPKCSKFISENESSLRKLKNKRQLLMFLNRKFEKVHHLKGEAYSYADRTKSAKVAGTCSSAILLICLLSLLLTVVSLTMLCTLFFRTNIFETLFYSHPQYTHFIKTSKTFLSAMMREL